MRLGRSQMTDTQKFWADVHRTGEDGAHSHDLAKSIPSLNVSQRAKDCASKGQEVFTATERRNGRPGARFWIGAHNAPDYAVPVRANGAASDGSPSAAQSPPPPGAAPAEPKAIVLDFRKNGQEQRGERLPNGTRCYREAA